MSNNNIKTAILSIRGVGWNSEAKCTQQKFILYTLFITNL
jgi:hypothetical protein